ncbi:MAG: hypothetical protein QXW70_01860 [Candidatus Anstonellales archaeon]
MKKSAYNHNYLGFMTLELSISFLLVLLNFMAFVQYCDKILAVDKDILDEYTKLRKISDLSTFLVKKGLVEEHPTYYNTHILSPTKLSIIEQLQEDALSQLNLNSVKIYISTTPPPENQHRICVTRIVLLSNKPSTLIVCGN